ncbi:hypothetical protein OUZ56_011350 [Daphnia magna]|uniref:Uncharacterized protein n=1 Tax=Daphnia magna TaxID=35525 RepID=A0ABQ9YZV5_9CRUS|nr:hypothetical protein OUZ56_011350 [Daphnia magna]
MQRLIMAAHEERSWELKLNVSFLFVDTVSYDENVTKMLELFSNGDGITPVLVILSKATYNGRRKQFQNCELSTIVQDVVKNVCPLLQFQPFLNDEMEGIIGT